MSINQRVLIGFVILILIFGITGYLSLNNLERSTKITAKNSQVIQPSIILVKEFQLLATNAKNYTNTWVIIDLSDHEDKVKLQAIHDHEYVDLKQKLEYISKQWENPQDQHLLEESFSDFEEAMEHQKVIMDKLDNIDAYGDLLVRGFEIEQGELPAAIAANDSTLKVLHQLNSNFDEHAKTEEKDILDSFSSIKTASILATIIALLVSVAIAIAVLRSVKLQEQKKQVTEERDQIQLQKAIIEEKNRDIMSSITYAKRIQNSLLPTNHRFAPKLTDRFVLFLPRDIVSGDFYWSQEVVNDKNETLVFVAAADCTGHGVPGAFVSFVCHNSLNRAVNEFELISPAKILDSAREFVIDTFAYSDEENVRDGMDIALCCINTNTLEMTFSGANNPAWIIRNGETTVLRADRQPVGIYESNEQFTEHTFQLEKGDSIYLFSDGYADQFGGPNGKKLKSKPMMAMLESIQELSMKAQHEQMLNNIVEWKGDQEQIDDILLIGLKV